MIVIGKNGGNGVVALLRVDQELESRQEILDNRRCMAEKLAVGIFKKPSPVVLANVQVAFYVWPNTFAEF